MGAYPSSDITNQFRYVCFLGGIKYLDKLQYVPCLKIMEFCIVIFILFLFLFNIFVFECLLLVSVSNTILSLLVRHLFMYILSMQQKEPTTFNDNSSLGLGREDSPKSP